MSSTGVAIVQVLNQVWFFETPWTVAHQAPLSFTLSWSLLRFMSIELVMLSNHLILCHPLLLLPSIFPSISVFYWSYFIPLVKHQKMSTKPVSTSKCYVFVSFPGTLFFLIQINRTYYLNLMKRSNECAIRNLKKKSWRNKSKGVLFYIWNDWCCWSQQLNTNSVLLKSVCLCYNINFLPLPSPLRVLKKSKGAIYKTDNEHYVHFPFSLHMEK